MSANGRLRAVVFDNDGLLLDTEECWTRAEQELFGRRGRVFTPAHKRELLGSSPQVTADWLARTLEQPGDGAALVTELGMLVLAELADYAAPRPGALELIAALRAGGIPLALASNSPGVLIEQGLATAGIEPATFTTILTADMVTEPKPAPEIYLTACAALGTDPAQTLVLEDSPTGVAAGIAAGCFTIAVPSIAGVDLGAASLVVDSLASPEITRLLGL